MTRPSVLPPLTPLAKRIRRLRKAKGMSLRDLAEAADVKPPSVYDWEHALSAPRSHRLQRVAVALGVSVGELLGVKVAA